MDIKQKSLLVLTIAALGFLGYQIFELVDRDISETPVYNDVSLPMASKPAKPLAYKSVVDRPAAHVPTQPLSQSVAMTPVKAQAVTGTKATSTNAPNLSDAQRAYVSMLNTYEVEKMHRQLLEEEAAVATAQHQIAELNEQTKKLNGGAVPASTVGQIAQAEGRPVVLSYIDQQQGRWRATLRMHGAYVPVRLGSTLDNGFKVTAIDQTGVTLANGRAREQVTFHGVIHLPPAEPAHVQLAAIEPGVNSAKHVITQHDVNEGHARLVAMQMLHHGQEVKAVARQSLAMTPAKPALKVKPLATVHVEKRTETPTAVMQVSTHDQYADESEDDMQNKQLSHELNLRSVEIQPVINQPYNVSAYLSQQADVPRAYPLDFSMVVDGDDANTYASESADTQFAAPKKYTSAEKHFLSLKHGYYTIQLIGSHDDAVVHQFMLDNELNHVALPLTIGRSQHPWYVAVYGVYQSFDAAQHKLVHLPHHLKINGAWIRQVGDIQHSLKRAHHV